MTALPRPDARATAAGYTWSHQVGRPGGCLMAQVWAPDGRSVATIEPTDDPAVASRRAELCALALAAPEPAQVEPTHPGQEWPLVKTALQRRVMDLHEKAFMPMRQAEEQALSEEGVDDDVINDLLADASHKALQDQYLLDAEDMRQIARHLLVWSPLSTAAVSPPVPMSAGARQVVEQLLAKARSVIATIEPESLAEHEQLQQLIAGIDAVTAPAARSDLFAGGGL